MALLPTKASRRKIFLRAAAFVCFLLLLLGQLMYGKRWIGPNFRTQKIISSQPTKHAPTSPAPERLHPDDIGYPVFKNSDLRPIAARPPIHIDEIFPLAAHASSPSDLPPIPSWNQPPAIHVDEATPLFIGFTRNWSLLQQTLVSLLTAGWPPSDIYVVENTGVMDANAKGRLSPQNPFYLDHHRLQKVFGVNVVVMPSLQTFAQLQNYYLFRSLNEGWPQYYWAHMDIVALSPEAVDDFKSFYLRAVEALRDSRRNDKRWAVRYFAYDWVTLMNVEAMVDLGGWDSMIGYYTADCDLYARINMKGYSTRDYFTGPVFDTGSLVDDLAIFYRVGDERNSSTFHDQKELFSQMARTKNDGALGERNRWQWMQTGGQDDPYYRDMDGFMEALEMTVQAGIKVFQTKWGHPQGCNLGKQGLKAEYAWLIEKIEKYD